MTRLASRIWREARFGVAALAIAAACAEPRPVAAAKADYGAADADATAGGDAATPDAARTPPTDAGAGKEVATDTSKEVDAAKAIPCAARAGGYAVSGTCSNGATSIPFACMLVDGCDLIWQTDFRDWKGPLVGTAYTLTNAAKTETISGQFDDASSGSYTYVGGGISCQATMDKFESTFAGDICCDVVKQGCGDGGTACVPIQDQLLNSVVLTTGCVGLAATATTSVGAACLTKQTALTCGKGLLCVGDLSPAAKDAGHCAKLCTAQTDCAAGQQCEIITGAPKSGHCSAPCAPLAAAGSAGACPSGQACLPAPVSNAKGERVMGASCAAAGDGGEGAACGAASGCVAGLVCAQKTCRPLCDDLHPCGTGSCTGFGIVNGPGVGKGFGYCK